MDGRRQDVVGHPVVGFVEVVADAGPVTEQVQDRDVVGDGGLFTTLADLRSFWATLLAGRIVPPDVLAQMTLPRSESPDDDRRYGLGFWLPAGGDAIQLEGYDAGISFLSTCVPSTGAVTTMISNWTDGAWPIARFFREVDAGG